MNCATPLLAILLLVVSPPAAQDGGPDETLRLAEREATRVMNAGLPFAERMLEEHGEFFPFGAVMLKDRLIRTVGAFDDREQPPAEEVLALLLSRLHEEAETSEYRATAVFVIVRLRHPQDGRTVNAVQVGLEHRDGYCVDVFFPVEDGLYGVTLGEPFAGPREGAIFDACNESRDPVPDG